MEKRITLGGCLFFSFSVSANLVRDLIRLSSCRKSYCQRVEKMIGPGSIVYCTDLRDGGWVSSSKIRRRLRAGRFCVISYRGV